MIDFELKVGDIYKVKKRFPMYRNIYNMLDIGDKVVVFELHFGYESFGSWYGILMSLSGDKIAAWGDEIVDLLEDI